ncbi:hypothetical protein GUITHDRAFT_160781 [Guillardia theta CCMP2712]|uniref:Uncharacterized protein n=2 Tax=Guillardia theta TaxID=55529 RepID=L1K0E2_GUITC|nr:hypothetical protein GUITHDRAFT_160781 [Guillardia theta CCMP2712]EKX54034.1 hypothetical protein GUITHDRAFT_160781 [Guillardia theta CCMP2712]|eukprot:XP_005841014.1 hypothetical protein GUITHDRAFT_160781 [Guillardia theta CCMP2712]
MEKAAGERKNEAKPREEEKKSGSSKATEAAVQRLRDGRCKMILLCDIKLNDPDVTQLAPAVKQSTCLRSLSLHGANLSVSSAKLLANALASHEALTMLDLGNNLLGSKGVEDVCNALIHNTSLLALGLARTAMGDSGATAMAHVLRINCSLTEVYLNSNDITEEGATDLSGALLFNDSSRLSKLYLYGNPLGKAGVDEFKKLEKDCPFVQERVPLDDARALAFAMATHKRLGENSQVKILNVKASVHKSEKGIREVRRSNPLLRVIRACSEYRQKKREFYGLEANKS